MNEINGGWKALQANEITSAFNDHNELVKLCNRQRLQLHNSPAASNFRVFAFLVITADDHEGYCVVEGANHEQGYIGGAICGERAALSRLRFFKNPKIHKIVV